MATSRKSTAGFRLRSGSFDDLDEVMRIMRAAFQPCFGEAWTRSQCAGIMPMAGVTLTIAEDGDESVGFALVRSVSDEAELLLLAVDPEQQRSGIGQILLDQFIAGSLSQGAHRLHLEVRDGNPAVSLYQAAGFTTAGRRRNYYRGPDGETYDAVTLVLTD